MRIRYILIASCLAFSFSPNSYAAEEHSHEHGGGNFHAFRLETDYGAGNDDPIASWDFDGWIGGDTHKLWLKSEGEWADGQNEQAEFWGMYSRNVAEFWDVQIGMRHDSELTSTNYVVMGVNGLAPYFFETEAHLFISDEGDVSLRLRQENDFLITQRLIVQPYLEANLFAQEVQDQEVGAGLTNAEIGLQTRYEVTRKFAPYIDVRYEHKFSETATIAKHHGENRDNLIGSVGVRLMF